MKITTWNVNGLRAAFRNQANTWWEENQPDLLCLQEIRARPEQLTQSQQKRLQEQETVWHPAERPGYSGVAAYSRLAPQAVRHGIGIPRFDDEGRIIEMEFDAFTLFNVYFPNGQMSDARLQYKLDFYRDFFDYVQALRTGGRPVIITGDFNTAHNEIDLKNPGPNSKRSGFLPVERQWLDRIVAMGYVDTFRHLYPDTVKYSWWSYRFNARKNNAGWRIDYFFVSDEIVRNGWLKDAFINNTVFGSDHCPVGLVLEI